MKNKIVTVIAFLAVMAAMTVSVGAISPPGCTTTGIGISMSPSEVVQVGDTIPYKVIVSLPNPATDCDVLNGKMTFTDPAGISPPGSPLPFTLTHILGNPASHEFGPFNYVVREQDIVNGKVKATASVTGISQSTTGQNVTASTEIDSTVIILNTTLTKTASPTSGPAPLNVVYTVTETNNGNVPLTAPVLVSVPPSIFTFVGGDVNGNNILDPTEKWTFTENDTLTVCGPNVNRVTASSHPIVNNTPLQNITHIENASATVFVECPTGGKVVGWGIIGHKADPEKIIKIFAYSEFLPQGEVDVQDNVKGLHIKATQVDSVSTNKNVDPKTGIITGKATVNGAGPYKFTVNIKDGGNPPDNGEDWFSIDVESPAPYHNEGKLSSGNIDVEK